MANLVNAVNIIAGIIAEGHDELIGETTEEKIDTVIGEYSLFRVLITQEVHDLLKSKK